MTTATSLQVQGEGLTPCPNMIAIASGKGGVGKTWLAIALSHAFANMGRRALLFDGDLGLANVDVQIGLTPKHDLGGVLAGRHDLAKAVTTFAPGGFDIIAGRSGSGSLASLPPRKLAAISQALTEIAPRYEDVILDLGAGIERTVRLLAQQAATCLVVTTSEPTALTDAYAFIKLTLQQDPQTDLRIVINLVGSVAEGERTFATLRKACESFLKAQPALAGVIPRDIKVRESIRSQTPILTRHPNAPAAAAVEKLAQDLRKTTKPRS